MGVKQGLGVIVIKYCSSSQTVVGVMVNVITGISTCIWCINERTTVT